MYSRARRMSVSPMYSTASFRLPVDLARDADLDPRFPDAALLSRYVLYLERRHASSWAMRAVGLAWDEWLHGRGELGPFVLFPERAAV